MEEERELCSKPQIMKKKWKWHNSASVTDVILSMENLQEAYKIISSSYRK